MAHVFVYIWVMVVMIVVVGVSGDMDSSEMITSERTFTTNSSTNVRVFNENCRTSENEEYDNEPCSDTVVCKGCETPITTPVSVLTLINSGSISRETYYGLFAVYKYLQFILIGLGIVFNVLNIVVFSNKRMKSPTTRILLFLSSSELCLACLNCFMTCLKIVLGRDAINELIYITMTRYIRMYINAALRQCSFCFNMFVATERSIAIAFPLRSQYLRFCRKPSMFCMICLVVNFIYQIYNPLKIEVVEITINNATAYSMKDTKLFSENRDLFAAVNMLGKILFTYIPLCGSLVLNLFMLVALGKQRKKRVALNIRHQQTNNYEFQTTFTILVSSFLFVMLAIPLTIPSILSSMNQEIAMYKKEHYLFNFLAMIFGMCSSLSLSVNFCVYMVLSSQFRNTFRLIARDVIHCLSFNRNNEYNHSSLTPDLRSQSGSSCGVTETQLSIITCPEQELAI